MSNSFFDLPPISQGFDTFFDEWNIPENLEINKIPLGNFIRVLQDQFRLGNQKLVLNILNETVPLCTDENKSDRVCAFILLWRGIVNRKMGNLPTAFYDLLHASKYFKITGDFENLARNILCMGDVWRAKATISGKHKKEKYLIKSLRYYHESREIFDKNIPMPLEERSAILLLAQILWAEARSYLSLRQHIDLVFDNLFQAWKFSELADSVWAKEECAQLIAKSYEMERNLDEAIKWYKISYDEAKKSGNVDRLIESSLLLARLSKKIGNKLDAQKYAKNALQLLKPLLSQGISKKHQFFQFYRHLSQLEK